MASAFRPDYLKVARFAKEIRAERVVALTATATPRVGRDICKAFDIPEDRLFRTATFRPNLHLQAVAGKTKTELYPQLFDFLRKHKGSTIVYVTLQKHTEELAARLRSNKFNAQAFHAGLATEVKTKRQEEFMRSDNSNI